MRTPRIAVSLGAVAVAGFAYLAGPGPAFGILIDSPIRTVTNFNFSVIPMFILMGAFVSASGMSRELFRVANAWVGHLPGGTAIATIFACGGFAAINGSSIASAATMTQVALPEMRRVGYDPGLSAGVVAAGGTLGIMIPPSVMFILYSILTDTNLTALFIAGILPGLIAIALYCVTVLLLYRVHPDWMPRALRADRRERWEATIELRKLIGTILRERFVPYLERQDQRIANADNLLAGEALVADPAQLKALRTRLDKLQTWQSRARTFLPLIGKML